MKQCYRASGNRGMQLLIFVCCQNDDDMVVIIAFNLHLLDIVLLHLFPDTTSSAQPAGQKADDVLAVPNLSSTLNNHWSSGHRH